MRLPRKKPIPRRKSLVSKATSTFKASTKPILKLKPKQLKKARKKTLQRPLLPAAKSKSRSSRRLKPPQRPSLRQKHVPRSKRKTNSHGNHSYIGERAPRKDRSRNDGLQEGS